ncbi:MAG: DUF4124 domain-containing protein [Bacteroidota bacterium]
MKTTFALALVVAATTTISSAHAQTYQWKDSKGKTVISDTPPPGSAKPMQTLGSSPTPSAEKAPEAAKTAAEKDMEFKKRQQDARDKADKEAKEQSAAAEKRENCERARRNLAALESAQPLATLDAYGQRKTMDNSQREQEMERARQFMADSCK